MTMEQAILIRIFLENAYPNFKSDERSERVYMDMLQDYDYKIMIEAAKDFARTSPYPPSIANLVTNYEILKTQILIDIVNEMNRLGYFKKPTKEEKLFYGPGVQIVTEYEKSLSFVERGIIPDFLKRDIWKFYKTTKGEDLRELLGLRKEENSKRLENGYI